MGWRDNEYTSHINKKVFFEILDKSFQSDKVYEELDKSKQDDILDEIKNHIKSFNPDERNSWNERFDILKKSLGDKGRYCSHVTGETVLQYYNIKNAYVMKDYIFVQIKGSSHTQQELFMVIFFKDNILNIELPVYKYPYKNEALEEVTVRFDKHQTTKKEIFNFVDALMARQKEFENKVTGIKLKKTKVTGLKSRTIVSKIKEIMKEKKMTYCFDEKPNKIILIIKLSKSQLIEIAITFNKFHNALERLSELIDHLIELNEQGIEVKHKRTNKINSFRWIKN